MSGPRFLALVFAACALVATALMAIPLDGAEVPGLGQTGSIPDAAPYRLTAGPQATPSAPRAAASGEPEAAMPRLWLGSPMAR
jgi:hypothetical protein